MPNAHASILKCSTSNNQYPTQMINAQGHNEPETPYITFYMEEQKLTNPIHVISVYFRENTRKTGLNQEIERLRFVRFYNPQLIAQ